MGYVGWLIALLCTRHYLGSLVMAAILTAACTLYPTWGHAKTPLPPQERWPTCDNRSTAQKVSFVHISDMHANYNPDSEGASPVSRLRGYYETVRKENPFTVFTNSGDDYEKGSIAEELSRGRSTREVVQALSYDIRTLGNHDFAWGIKELLMFSNDPRAVVLSTNTRINRQVNGPLQEISAGFTDFSILTVGCIRIGFFGLTARPYGADGGQHNGPVYPALPALEMDFDFIGISKQIIAKHRHEVDVLVLVSHIGLTDDIAIAEQTEGIDLILGGHSHTTLENPRWVKNTAIVHVGAHAEQIGRYDLLYDLKNKTISDSNYQLVANTSERIPADEGMNKTVATILQRYQREIRETVAEVRNSQSPPAMARIAALAAVEKLPIDAAFVGVGSVWQEWRPGRLTRQDILDAFRVEREPVGTPGASSLYVMEVAGADLLHARAVLKDVAYWGPSEIDPTSLYTLAMQKPQVFGQLQHFSRTIAITPPRPAAELWEVVSAYAGDQNFRNLALEEGSNVHFIDNIIATLANREDKHPAL